MSMRLKYLVEVAGVGAVEDEGRVLPRERGRRPHLEGGPISYEAGPSAFFQPDPPPPPPPPPGFFTFRTETSVQEGNARARPRCRPHLLPGPRASAFHI